MKLTRGNHKATLFFFVFFLSLELAYYCVERERGRYYRYK